MGDAHAGKNTNLQVTGDPVSFGVAHPLQVVAGSGGTVWQIQDTTKDIWDPRANFTIEINGSPATPGVDYQIGYLFGYAQFASDQTGNTIEVTAGDYLPHYYVPLGRTVDWTDGHETIDITTFFNDAEQFILGTRTLEAVVEHLDNEYLPLDGQGGAESTLQMLVDDGSRLVLEYGPEGTDTGDASGARQGLVNRAFVRPSNKQTGSSPNEAVSKEITFVLDRIEAAMASQTSKAVSTWSY